MLWTVKMGMGPVRCQALKAVLTVSEGVGYYSATVFQQAILRHYVDSRLLPQGMQVQMDCIQKWSLKMGLALRRMVSC